MGIPASEIQPLTLIPYVGLSSLSSSSWPDAGEAAAWLPAGGGAIFNFTAKKTGEYKIFAVREKVTGLDVPIGVVRFTVAASRMSAGHSAWVLLNRYTTGMTSFTIEAKDAYDNAVLTESQLLSTTVPGPRGALSVKICPPAAAASSSGRRRRRRGRSLSSSSLHLEDGGGDSSSSFGLFFHDHHEGGDAAADDGYSDSGLDVPVGHIPDDAATAVRHHRRNLLSAAAACGSTSCPDGAAFLPYTISPGPVGALTVRFSASVAGEYALSACGVDDRRCLRVQGVALGASRSRRSGGFVVSAVTASAAQSVSLLLFRGWGSCGVRRQTERRHGRNLTSGKGVVALAFKTNRQLT